MLKTDIIYLVKNRLEFTQESLLHLDRNTDWRLVSRLHFYLDVPAMGENDGAIAFAKDWHPASVPFDAVKVTTTLLRFGGPVNVMLYHLDRMGVPIGLPMAGLVNPGPLAPDDYLFVKLDNDVVVPPGWLQAGLDVMERNPGLDLLGIEPPLSRTQAPWKPGQPVHHPESMPLFGDELKNGYVATDSIGGVGFMRARAFRGRPLMQQFATYGGFTDWQTAHPSLAIGWLVPPIKLYLLDRMPMGPWVQLSKEYERKGWQRPWTRYSQAAAQELMAWSTRPLAPGEKRFPWSVTVHDDHGVFKRRGAGGILPDELL